MTKSIVEDIRIKGYNALLTPNYVKEEFPLVSLHLFAKKNLYTKFAYSRIYQKRQLLQQEIKYQI
jgi:hypothetical protein